MEFVVAFFVVVYYGIYYGIMRKLAVMDYLDQRRIDQTYRAALTTGLAGLSFYRFAGKPLRNKIKNINWKKEGF